jgi:hypothetical protein
VRFSEDEERFLKPGCDRLVALAGLLAARSVPYSVARTGADRHIIARIGRGRPALALAAHYDRVEGSPGVLDNSCACLQLVALAASLSAASRSAAPPGGAAPSEGASLIIAFTDAEEAPRTGAALSQGSYGLAVALQAAYLPRRAARDRGRASAAVGAVAAVGAAGAAAPSPPPTLVLDVTGRGDRLVYSTSAEALLSRAGLSASPAAEGRSALVADVVAAASRASLRPPLPVALPWSDDLGLTLGGLPALALSLLPEDEAALCARGGRPPTWDLLHGPDDGPDLAEEAAFELMASFLAELVGL